MNRIISIANQKGGVGKTTTTINLAASLAKENLKILIIDLDPQGNTTSGLGLDKSTLTHTAFDVLVEDQPIFSHLQPTSFENISIIPSNSDLVGAEMHLMQEEDGIGKWRLTKALQEFFKSTNAQPVSPIPQSEQTSDQYTDTQNTNTQETNTHETNIQETPLQAETVQPKPDLILIDCPPSLGLLTLNALIASHSLLIPVQCEYYALEGLTELFKTLTVIQQQFNPGLVLEGIILTMFDTRTTLCHQVEAELRKYYQQYVYKTVIPRSVRLSEAPSFGKPIVDYAPHSRGAKAYLELAKEVINHEEERARARALRAAYTGDSKPTHTTGSAPVEPTPTESPGPKATAPTSTEQSVEDSRREDPPKPVPAPAGNPSRLSAGAR